MNYETIDLWMKKQKLPFSFQTMIRPEFWEGRDGETFVQKIGKIIFQVLETQKEPFITLLAICILFGVLSQVAKAFERKELENSGFYIHFVCCAGICMRLFLEAYWLVARVIANVISFMQVLAPTYCFSVMCSSGPQKATAYYGLLLLVIFVAQLLIQALFLPGAKVLMAIQFANAGTGQTFLSKTCQLISDGIKMGLKTMVGIICGWQMVRSLLTPSIGSEGGMATRAFSFLPGIGQLTSASARLFFQVAGAVKNSIGAGGLLVITILVGPSLITLSLYLLGFRALEALLQPMVQEKVVTLFSGCAQCLSCLLKILTTVYLLLFISLSILTVLS